jgi:hypothetical protein
VQVQKVSLTTLPALEDAIYTSTSRRGAIGALIRKSMQRALEQS